MLLEYDANIFCSIKGNKISQTMSKGFDLLQANRITQNESKQWQSTSAKWWHPERYQRHTYNTSRQHKHDYSLNNTDLKVYVSSGWKKTIWNIFYKNPPRLDSSLLFICDSVPLWIIHNDKMQMRRSSTVFKVCSQGNFGSWAMCLLILARRLVHFEIKVSSFR